MNEFRISQLLARAAKTIRSVVPVPRDGRVQTTLDVRTLRYYQSQGLIDKPLRYEGREAVYGVSHLHQLVVIKALQGSGYRLDQIQRRLAGVSHQELQDLYLQIIPDNEIPQTAEPEAAPLRKLMSFELQPGVVLTIDPEAVSEPSSIIARIRSALNQQEPK